jgi:hypothetical protein
MALWGARSLPVEGRYGGAVAPAGAKRPPPRHGQSSSGPGDYGGAGGARARVVLEWEGLTAPVAGTLVEVRRAPPEGGARALARARAPSVALPRALQGLAKLLHATCAGAPAQAPAPTPVRSPLPHPPGILAGRWPVVGRDGADLRRWGTPPVAPVH